MTVIGVRFLLKYQQFLDVPMSDGEARHLIDSFANKRCPDTITGGGPAPWVILLENVMAVHAIVPQPAQPGYDPAAMSGGQGNWRMS